MSCVSAEPECLFPGPSAGGFSSVARMQAWVSDGGSFIRVPREAQALNFLRRPLRASCPPAPLPSLRWLSVFSGTFRRGGQWPVLSRVHQAFGVVSRLTLFTWCPGKACSLPPSTHTGPSGLIVTVPSPLRGLSAWDKFILVRGGGYPVHPSLSVNVFPSGKPLVLRGRSEVCKGAEPIGTTQS